MRRGRLRDCFVGVGVKRLSAVDAEAGRSNQHEIGTTREMRDQFLGEIPRRQFPATYAWLGENESGFTAEGTATHYDARNRNADRAPEWRLYYSSNPVTEAMREGDALFLAMAEDGLLHFIVAPAGSTGERQLSWLFDLHPEGQSFVSRAVADDGPGLDFAAHFILDEIGIEVEEPDGDRLDAIVDQFGMEFPNTATFSETARRTLPDVRAQEDPDAALVAWLSHEEALFRRLERRIVASRIEEGFRFADGQTDVEGFLRFSLSVHNRRKSRMGRSLEHHLEAVFRAHGIAFVREVVTENNHQPDFLFPDQETYRAAPDTGRACLTMLGAKSSCKDRWRQVLAEASKIPRKHLLTLEPGISEPQTTQMENSDLQLVVPQSIQNTYTQGQRTWLWNLDRFIRDVRDRAGK